MGDGIRGFFELNHEIVLFVYGQVFFVLGLAVALQSRRHSRLELARSLRWLAIFGLTHGFHEWGLLLVPVQAAYLSREAIDFLIIIRTLLLAVSFAALFQFGAELTRDRWPKISIVPTILLTLWITYVTLFGLLATPGIGPWEQAGSISARYTMALPGGMLAAWGLRYQADRQILPLGLNHIYSVLRVAGLSLAAYALFGGLVVPFGDFFPANLLNQSAVVDTFGIPIEVFRSATGLVLALTIIRALEVFDVEVDQLIERMELEQGLAAERERIGRELHDGALQRVYTAGLIVESARSRVKDESTVGQRLDRAILALSEAIDNLRAYMTELRTSADPISLYDGLVKQAGDPHLAALMDIRLQLELSEDDVMHPARSAHILAIVGEALANAARHAQARQVSVRAHRHGSRLQLEISDNGRGFVLSDGKRGYGLRNMHDRARLIGGELEIESKPGTGTRILLTAPWEEA